MTLSESPTGAVESAAFVAALRSALEGNAPALTDFDDDTELALIRTAASDGQAGLQAVLDRGDYAPYHEAIRKALTPLPRFLPADDPTFIAPAPVIAGYVYERSLTMITGVSGIGKGFFILSAIVEPAIHNGMKVGMIAYEDAFLIRYRYRALTSYRGRKTAQPLLLETPELFQLDQDLKSPLIGEALIAAKLDLLVIDPLFDASAGLDMNTTKDASLAMMGLRDLTRELNAPIVFAHHSGEKGKPSAQADFMASSRILQAVDISVKLTAANEFGEDSVRVECKKHRFDKRWDSKLFRSEARRGNRVLYDTGEGAPRKQANRQTNQDKVLAVLKGMTTQSGSRADIVELANEVYAMTDKQVNSALQHLLKKGAVNFVGGQFEMA